MRSELTDVGQGWKTHFIIVNDGAQAVSDSKDSALGELPVERASVVSIEEGRCWAARRTGG